MMTLKEKLLNTTFLCLAFALVWLVYSPGLKGGFIFDDFPNIVRNEAVAIDTLNYDDLRHAAFSGTAGPLKRPISSLSFAVNYYASGLDSYSFKAVNVLIHCINGLGIYLLTTLLLKAYQITHGVRITRQHVFFISTVTAAAWLLHPLQLTSVLYVVQRMVELATFFCLLGLILYCVGRLRQLKGRSGYLWIGVSLLLATTLAALSKENGILLPILAAVIEITVFRFKIKNNKRSTFLMALSAAIIFVPILATSYVLAFTPELLLSGYQTRDFTVYQRILTESRAIWFYISQIILPTNRELGIYHDDFRVSTGLLDPPWTLAASLGVGLLLTIAAFTLKRAPIVALGILFFFAGHAIESTILPLELIHEHRNYLPSYGLLLVVVYYSAYPILFLDSLRIRQAAIVLFVGVLAFATAARSQMWSDPLSHATFEVENHPDSPRANLAMGEMYMSLGLADKQNANIFLAAAKSHFQRSSQLRESFRDGLFGLLVLSSKTNHSMPDDAFDDLINRLRDQPFSSNTVNWIAYLSECIAKAECNISAGKMTAIIQAALENETIKSRTKAELYTASSNYFFFLKDYQSALYLSASATAELPNISRYRLNLVNMLIILQRFEDARAELEQAKLDDHFGVHRFEIKRLASILNKME